MKALSAIKPSGSLTLGNYLGAIKPFVQMQDKNDMLIFIADLHALTKPIDPMELRESTRNLIATYLAAGLDPHKVILFKQSDIPAHCQLEWILTCNTVLGEFTKMPQYKNFLESNKGKAVPTGMLMYPSLMNADILLYDPDIVPVGLDQMSHVDLCRDVAEKFNKHYGETFKLPQGVLQKTGAKIMSLSDPTKKMSKSESDKGTIYLLEDVSITRKKIMRALTDPFDKVHYDPQNQPGVSNLMTIYSCITGLSFDSIETKYTGMNYGAFKKDLADIVCQELELLQERVKLLKHQFASDGKTDYITNILEIGKTYADGIASKKINEVYHKIGIR